MTELALFSTPGEPDGNARIRSGTRRGVTWSAHNGRMRCDDCRADQAVGRLTSIARAARWRRCDGESDRYLCYGHAHAWRDQDEKEVSS